MRPSTLSMRDLLDAAEAVWLEAVMSPVDVTAALTELDRQADQAIATEETWGMSPTAEADAHTMEALYPSRRAEEPAE